MSYIYDQRKRPQGHQNTEPGRTASPGPGMEALMAGTARPTAAQKGQPFDLDAAIKAKMENAFGDLSAVKFYKSRAVGDAGAEAIAQGNEIAFAPGMADFSTKAGQERLGHELSHVMSQRSGAVRGSGFLNDSSLEARADREGAMAAAGQQIYTGPVTHTFSGAAPSPFVAGAMQAKRDDSGYRQKWVEDGRQHREVYEQAVDQMADDPNKKELRPYEIPEADLQRNPFNPTGNKSLAVHQAAIDITNSPSNAYQQFAVNSLDENGESEMGQLKPTDNPKKPDYDDDWDPYHVDPKHFKSKLKNMARMVHDYPELAGKMGNMTPQNSLITVMSAGTTRGGTEPGGLTYNASIDSMSFWGRMKRKLFSSVNKKFGITTQASLDYTGTHELGHVLNSLLLNPKNADAADDDWEYNITANSIVDTALKNVMLPEEYKKLKRHKKNNAKKKWKRNQLNLSKSNLYKKGYTSRYGETNASEFFAEAFADVYSRGENARPVSIAVVKEYERRRDEMKNRPTFSGLDGITDNDFQADDLLNTSMIAKAPKKPRKKKGK